MTTQSHILKDATPANTITLENVDGVFSIKKGETGPTTLFGITSGAASASTTNTVTNKIAVTIGGVTYYLLASTSGA